MRSPRQRRDDQPRLIYLHAISLVATQLQPLWLVFRKRAAPGPAADGSPAAAGPSGRRLQRESFVEHVTEQSEAIEAMRRDGSVSAAEADQMLEALRRENSAEKVTTLPPPSRLRQLPCVIHYLRCLDTAFALRSPRLSSPRHCLSLRRGWCKTRRSRRCRRGRSRR